MAAASSATIHTKLAVFMENLEMPDNAELYAAVFGRVNAP